MQTNFGTLEGLVQGLAVVSSMKAVLSASAFRNGPWRRFVGDRGMNMKELKVDESSAVRVMMGRCPLGPTPDFLRASARPKPWWRMEIGMDAHGQGGRRAFGFWVCSLSNSSPIASPVDKQEPD